MADVRRRGFKYDAENAELRIETDGKEHVAMDATGIGFLGADPIAATAITGDISAYNETTLKAILTQLDALGLLTDSTTT